MSQGTVSRKSRRRQPLSNPTTTRGTWPSTPEPLKGPGKGQPFPDIRGRPFFGTRWNMGMVFQVRRHKRQFLRKDAPPMQKPYHRLEEIAWHCYARHTPSMVLYEWVLFEIRGLKARYEKTINLPKHSDATCVLTYWKGKAPTFWLLLITQKVCFFTKHMTQPTKKQANTMHPICSKRRRRDDVDPCILKMVCLRSKVALRSLPGECLIAVLRSRRLRGTKPSLLPEDRTNPQGNG